MQTTQRIPTLALLFVGLLPFTVLAADDKTQTVEGPAIKFDVPASWKTEAPESAMRQAQLKVEPAEGDEKKTELILFTFPGGAGNVDANVARWQGMFKDKDGNPPKVDIKKVKGKNVDATRVEMAGTYTPSSFGQPKKSEPQSDHHLLAAIVITPDSSYFIRMVGPEKTVKASREAFDKLIASIQVAGK